MLSQKENIQKYIPIAFRISPIGLIIIINTITLLLVAPLSHNRSLTYRYLFPYSFSISRQSECREVAQKYEPVGRGGERAGMDGRGVGGVGEYERGLRR